MPVTHSASRALFTAALFLGPITAIGSSQSAAEPPVARTGPDVGTRIPDFEVVDQAGKRQTFETLRGPKGLLLLFFRSADW